MGFGIGFGFGIAFEVGLGLGFGIGIGFRFGNPNSEFRNSGWILELNLQSDVELDLDFHFGWLLEARSSEAFTEERSSEAMAFTEGQVFRSHGLH